MVLQRYFLKISLNFKLRYPDSRKQINKIIFSSEILDLSIGNHTFLEKDDFGSREYRIYSPGIGINELNLKKEQSLYNGIVKKLNKQQKEESPSHVIVSIVHFTAQSAIKTHTVYRLTTQQESSIFESLMPGMVKRWKKLEELEKTENDKREEEVHNIEISE